MHYTLKLIRAALCGRWGGESDYFIPKRLEWFYRMKAALCLLIRRAPSPNTDLYTERVAVTYTDGGSYYVPGEPTTHWCVGLYTGHGFLRGWWAQEMEDSD